MKQRQAEGIRIAKQKGVKFGRPATITPDNFETVAGLYNEKKTTSTEAIIMSELTRGTFYRKLSYYKLNNSLEK